MQQLWIKYEATRVLRWRGPQKRWLREKTKEPMQKQPMEMSDLAQPKGRLFWSDAPRATKMVFPVPYNQIKTRPKQRNVNMAWCVEILHHYLPVCIDTKVLKAIMDRQSLSLSCNLCMSTIPLYNVLSRNPVMRQQNNIRMSAWSVLTSCVKCFFIFSPKDFSLGSPGLVMSMLLWCGNASSSSFDILIFFWFDSARFVPKILSN